MRPASAATDQVRAWTRTALQLECGAAPDPTPRDHLDADSLLAAVLRHRVVELLAAYAQPLAIPPAVAEGVRAMRAVARREAMVQVLELRRLSTILADAEIPWLALKGPALAAQSIGDFSARGCGDLDVFVSPETVVDTMRVLGGHGWRLRSSYPDDPRSWAWRHLMRTGNELTFDGVHSTVDLHWRLGMTQRPLPGFDAAWHRHTTVDVAGLEVATLCVRDAFSHSCYHAAKDRWRWLRSLVDVHRLARLPEVWQDGDHLRALDTSALAVTEATVGLPSDLPAFLYEAISAVPRRAVARAVTAQNRPAYGDGPPGVNALREVRHRMAVSRSAADVGHALAAAVLPADSVGGLGARSGWSALPRLLARRAVRVLGELVSWRGHGRRPGGKRSPRC